jgi:hypothetical protein
LKPRACIAVQKPLLTSCLGQFENKPVAAAARGVSIFSCKTDLPATANFRIWVCAIKQQPFFVDSKFILLLGKENKVSAKADSGRAM